jgi:hypothetical protein
MFRKNILSPSSRLKNKLQASIPSTDHSHRYLLSGDLGERREELRWIKRARGAASNVVEDERGK